MSYELIVSGSESEGARLLPARCVRWVYIYAHDPWLKALAPCYKFGRCMVGSARCWRGGRVLQLIYDYIPPPAPTATRQITVHTVGRGESSLLFGACCMEGRRASLACVGGVCRTWTVSIAFRIRDGET